MDAYVNLVDTFGRTPLLICFSHLRWDFVFQRPQHLLTRAARKYRVIFFEEPVEADISAPTTRRRAFNGSVVVVTPMLPRGYSRPQTHRAQRDLLDSLIEQEQRGPLILWYYTPAALAFSESVTADTIVYDCMDELSAFKQADPALKIQEEKLLRRADVVFTGGQSLYAAKKHLHNNIHPFPSSIDAAHFRSARQHPRPPEDVAHLSGPTLGFFGVIDERMDLELLEMMATGRPDWQFVMIGPVVKIDKGSLPQRKNIHWIGGRTYSQLPDYISTFDVGIMPFALNEATRFISPTKTPEFLAAGCPVLSTPINDVVDPYGLMGLVEIATDCRSAIASAERLMNFDRTTWLLSVDAHLENMSWDLTWSEMDRKMMRRARDTVGTPVAMLTDGELRV